MKRSVFASYVALVQACMSSAGHYQGEIDGIPGDETKSALPVFAEKFRDLVSQETFEAMPPRRQILALAQCICARSGMDVGHIDGVFRKEVHQCSDR